MGARLAEYGSAIRSENARAMEFAERVRSGVEGGLLIGAPQMISNHMLNTTIREFACKKPSLRHVCRTGTMTRLIEHLLAEEIDIAVGPIGDVHGAADLEVIPLLDDRISIFAKPTHALAHAPIGSRELASAKWISISSRTIVRTQMDAALAAMGVQELDLQFECCSEELALQLLRETDCLVMMPTAPLSKLVREGQFVALDFSHPELRHPIGAVHRKKHHLSSIQSAFLRDLHASFASQAFAQ